MTDPVEIIRDVDGVAHIRARDSYGAFFGQGYAVAQDRLWQIEYDRRRAEGRLAEVIGPRGVGTDLFHRRLGLAEAAIADYAALTPEATAALDAYADGINTHLAELQPEDLCPEMELLGGVPPAWEPWQSIALFKVRHLLMGTYEIKLWRSALVRNLGPQNASRLWPADGSVVTVLAGEAAAAAGLLSADLDRIADALSEIPEEHRRDSGGSNNIALHGSRTATGAPLLAGDPHRALDLPNVYWQNHIACDEFDAIGLSIPGVPGFPHFGHNATVAWCITHGMADDQDVFLERLRTDSAGRVEYEHDGAWRTARTRTERIDVAGGDAVTTTVAETHHGPILAGDPALGVGLALRWTALAERDSTFDSLVPMLRASNVGELDDAMRPWVVPVNNVLFADRSGDIAFRVRGRLALRASENGWTVVPGWDAAHDWRGWADYDDQPHAINPASSFFITANNPQSTDGPYVSNDFAGPARATRLTELVGGRADWSPDAIREVLLDDTSLVAPRFVEGLLAVAPGHRLERSAQASLRAWDFKMERNSAAAAIYVACRSELLRVVSHSLGLHNDRLGALGAGPALAQTARFMWTRLAALVAADDDSLLPGGWDLAFAAALRWGVRTLESRLGTDISLWRWGALHEVHWTHPLRALRPDLGALLSTPDRVEVGGDGDCVLATGVAPPSLEAVTGPVARYVMDLDDWDRSVWVVPNGVSGDPRSPHRSDQLSSWATGTMRPMRWTKESVDRDAAHRSIVSPRR